MKRRGAVRSWALALACVCLSSAPRAATAQIALDPTQMESSGFEATDAEHEAWLFAEAGRHVRAREMADAILKKDPKSFVAHLVIGYVNHYSEADFPRALYHLEQALALYEKRYTSTPGLSSPWRWHATLLRELGNVHGTLEHYSERLAFIARYNQLYEPDMIADRAWPLMKLGRYKEARKAAEAGLLVERPSQRAMALNALCAIEFEAGNDGASYEACRHALDDARQDGGQPSSVDLTNFAESSRSLFKLDEAERVGVEATDAELSWYGNPWMELAELYIREGRFVEALSSLKRIPEYRSRRPPHVRDADRNETWRAIAEFLLVVSRPDEAIGLTERALVLPDRRSHNSRDAAQDRIVVALLDRRAKRVAAEQLLEDAASEPLYKRPWLWAQALYLRVRALSSGAVVERLLRDEARLAGIFRIGTAASAVMPPWLAGELVQVLGSGVSDETLGAARARDKRPGAGAYYDAFAAESALERGDDARAVQLATHAEAGLPPGEQLLRARTLAIGAQAASESGQAKLAAQRYGDAFQADPGVFRRLELAVPVRIEARGPLAERVASMLLSSPRLREADGGLSLRIEGDASSGSACLVGLDQSAIGCGRATAEGTDDQAMLAARIVRDFHAKVFAPRVTMTQSDVNSLDGTNLVSDDALQTLFDSPSGTPAHSAPDAPSGLDP